MNEKEEILTTRIMSEVMDMQLSKYQSLFLYQLALRRYKIRKKDKDESLDESIGKVMKKMQEVLCSDEEYAFLDDSAKKRLSDIRRACRAASSSAIARD